MFIIIVLFCYVYYTRYSKNAIPCSVFQLLYCSIMSYSDCRDAKPCKGTVLRHTVDYIKTLQRDQQKLRVTSSHLKQTQDINRKMLLHIQVCLSNTSIIIVVVAYFRKTI